MNTYDHILYLPHKESKYRKRMSRYNRAAQFAPFAALTGYEEEIYEAKRETSERRVLCEQEKERLNRDLLEAYDLKSKICLTYFIADDKKAGGSYYKNIGTLKKIDTYLSIIEMDTGLSISIGDVYEIEFI